LDKTRAFRDALASFPTGVALVTMMDEGKATAMTVNSFASVSLEPPLILWSLARDSFRCAAFLNAGQFAVNVLAHDQRSLAEACAREDDLSASGARWTPGESGAPLVADTVARFECSRIAVHPGGDHDIIIGQVTRFDEPRKAPALVFFRSAYTRAG